MSDTQTAAWGPTARKIEPHTFVPPAGDYKHWCVICGYSQDAYQHASAEERAAFNDAQAAQAAERDAWRKGVGRRTAEIQERDYIVHALADQPGFILEQITTAPQPVSFRYFRSGLYVNVQISVEES